MVFGCTNFWSYPMFGWQNYGRCNYSSFITSPYAHSQYATRRQIATDTAAITSAFYPWTYTTPWGGTGSMPIGTSYQDAMNLNMMINNPYYTPYIDLSNVGGGISQEEQQRAIQTAKNSANRTVLAIAFSCLGSYITNLLEKINTDLQSPNLTADQRTALENLKAEVETIKQKREDLGRNSENMEVTDAMNAVRALETEYGQKSKKEEEIRGTIQCSSAGGAGGADGAGGAGGADGAGGAGGADGAGGAGGADGAGGAGGADGAGGAGGADGAGGAGGADPNANISQQYNNVLRPAIENILANPRLATAAPGAKEQIEQKQQELEQAMVDQKPTEEVQRIYNELNALVQDAQTKLASADAEWKTEVDRQSKQVQKDTQEFLSEYDDFIPKDSKDEIKEKLNALKAAIAANKPTEEIEKLYKELQTLVATVSEPVKKNYEESFNICSDIRTGAEGADWSGDGESKIKEAVNKINKNNVRSVFILWDKNFKSQFDDTCLLDTIFSEFRFQDSVKGELCDIILKAVEEFAKEKGIFNRVNGYITNINAKKPFSRWMSYSSVYQAFNEIVRIVKSANA